MRWLGIIFLLIGLLVHAPRDVRHCSDDCCTPALNCCDEPESITPASPWVAGADCDKQCCVAAADCDHWTGLAPSTRSSCEMPAALHSPLLGVVNPRQIASGLRIAIPMKQAPPHLACLQNVRLVV